MEKLDWLCLMCIANGIMKEGLVGKYCKSRLSLMERRRAGAG